MVKVFIDGSAGTTGLRIHERLLYRNDIEIVKLTEELRKDTSARAEAINMSDVVFLCLPDEAAIEAVSLCNNPDTVIIDTSTAHRTNDAWDYGFAEVNLNREKIAGSKRIANPGCHASGFIALVSPLVSSGLINIDAKLSCFSVTGYSGGGKKMIAQYEDKSKDNYLEAPRQYGLTQKHKHLPEMKKMCNLKNEPLFCPIVSNFYSGMEVSVPLFSSDVNGTLNDIKRIYSNLYTSKLVHFDENCDESGFLAANAFSGRDDMQITVFGNQDRILLTARYDNLGKGASGAAIQNMNIVLGFDEEYGLIYH